MASANSHTDLFIHTSGLAEISHTGFIILKSNEIWHNLPVLTYVHLA